MGLVLRIFGAIIMMIGLATMSWGGIPILLLFLGGGVAFFGMGSIIDELKNISDKLDKIR